MNFDISGHQHHLEGDGNRSGCPAPEWGCDSHHLLDDRLQRPAPSVEPNQPNLHCEGVGGR